MKVKFKRNYKGRRVLWAKTKLNVELGAPLQFNAELDHTIDVYKLHLALMNSLRKIMCYSKTTRKKIKRRKV